MARVAWRRFAIMSLLVFGAAAIYGAIFLVPPVQGAVQSMIYAAVSVIPLAWAESHADRSQLLRSTRRWPFSVVIALKSVLYAAWVLIGTLIAARLTHPPDAPPLGDLLIHREMIAGAVVSILVINVLLAVARLLGPGVLIRVMTGRYHRPRREERGFAFLDVWHSTQLAETIGERRFHAYLSALFDAVELSALAAGGEIHDYIGDQVMLSWPMKGSAPGPFAFIAALDSLIEERQASFRSRFGAEVRIRIGVHAGVVMAGEIGEFRQKIVFLGDTVNTAARVEELALDLGDGRLATAAALEHFPLPPTLAAIPLGPVAIRGKTEPVDLYNIVQSRGGDVSVTRESRSVRAGP